MRSRFEERVLAEDGDPAVALQEQLGIDASPDEYWTSVKENLTRGRIRGYLVADEIPEELRRIVDYLNRQIGENRFLALEVRQFQTTDRATTTLVPQVVAGSLEPPASASERGQTEAERLHMDFWTELGAYLREHDSAVSLPRPAGRSLMYLPLGRSGFRLCAWNLVVKPNAGVSFVITEGDASEHLERLREQHEARITDALARHGRVVWEARSAELAQIKIERDDLPLSDAATWPELSSWMASTLEAMQGLFRPIVQDLGR